MLINLYHECQIEYVLRVTHYQYLMALVWVKLWLNVLTFFVKLRIIGISLRYLFWVVLPFSSYTVVYYQFTITILNPPPTSFCAVDNSSGLDFA